MNWNSVSAAFLAVIFSLLSGLQARRRLKATTAASREDIKPVFGKSSTSVTVGLGETAILGCHIDHLGTREVIWRRENSSHPLTIGQSTFVSDHRLTADYDKRTNEWRLVIQDVQWSDKGLYLCLISTKETLEIDSAEVLLNVRSIQVSGTEIIECKGRIELECNATGSADAPHILDWYKDGNKVHSDVQKGIIITKKIYFNTLISVLVITSSKLSDAGVYLCRSSNRQVATWTVHVLNVAATIEKRGTYSEHVSSGQPRSPSFMLFLLPQILNSVLI